MTVTYANLGKHGRLGNQLFQIASTIGIALKNEQDFVFPLWQYENEFDNKLPTDYLINYKEYPEPDYRYHDIRLGKGDWNLTGYFQSWKYFQEYRKVIEHFLSFKKPCYNGVAVHVRRGDYVNLQHIHPLTPLDYYKQAMDYFSGESFTIFSDDIDWCIENLNGMNVSFYPVQDDIHDFKAMCGHQYFVISNSSYSWWAAYLSGSEKVIAPKKWVVGEEVDDRVPPEWIRI